MKKIHVAFLMANNSSVPYFNWFAERAAQDSNVRFTFVALTRERPKMIEDVGKYGWDCIWVPFDHEKRKSGLLKALFRLYKVFGKIKPDVVHSHLFDDAVPGLLAAKWRGVPVRVITKNDTSFHYYYAPSYVRFDRFNNRNATDIVAISDESRQFIIEIEGAPADKIVRIHHGISIDKMTKQSEDRKQRLRQTLGLEGRKVLGSVSRYIQWKGHHFMIEAAVRVVKQYPEALFLFAGFGPLKAELEQKVIDLKLQDHVKFLGWVDRDDMPTFYGMLDAFIHAASKEPFGFVIAEAMANGAPMVSTRTGAAADGLVHGESAYLIEPGNADAIAEGVLYMLADPERARKMAAKAIEAAHRLYDFEIMYQNHLALYRQRLKVLGR